MVSMVNGVRLLLLFVLVGCSCEEGSKGDAGTDGSTDGDTDTDSDTDTDTDADSDGNPPDGFDRHKFRWERGGIFFRSASTSTPWSWSEAEFTGTPGYVGGIIDEFTDLEVTYEKTEWGMKKTTDAELWFTASAWHGDGGDDIEHGDGIPGAYGVYTAVTRPNWVEYQFD